MEALNCCHNGKVSLPALHHYPPAMKQLFQDQEEKGKNFRENIRKYNSAYAFASFGADTVALPGRGTYCFRIHGQTYHSTGTLHPPPQTEPQYGQLYIIEGNQAVTSRMNSPYNTNCRQDIMEELQYVLQEVSPYAEAYRTMHAVELEEQQRARRDSTDPQQVRLYFKRGPDCRRYNEPVHDEIAAVFVGEDGAPPIHRDIVIYPRDRPAERISYLSCHLDPMCYPLLFPHGDPGWHNGMFHVPERRTATRNRLTMQQFYSFRLAIREEFSPIHTSGKLFQQYAVDAYVKTEGCRLYYIRNNQSQLRVELYSGKLVCVTCYTSILH